MRERKQGRERSDDALGAGGSVHGAGGAAIESSTVQRAAIERWENEGGSTPATDDAVAGPPRSDPVREPRARSPFGASPARGRSA